VRMTRTGITVEILRATVLQTRWAHFLAIEGGLAFQTGKRRPDCSLTGDVGEVILDAHEIKDFRC